MTQPNPYPQHGPANPAVAGHPAAPGLAAADPIGRPAAPFGDGMGDADQIDLVGMLHRSRKPLAIAGAIGLLLGLAAYFVLGPAYMASVQILVERKSSATANRNDVRTFGDRGVHVDLISSPKIVSQAIELNELDKLPSLAGASDPVEAIINALKVKRQSGDDRAEQNVLSINYQNASASDAKAVVEGIVVAYADYLREKRVSELTSLKDSLQKKDETYQAEIVALEEKIASDRKDSPLLFSTAPGQEGGGSAENPENPGVARAQQIDRQRRDTEAEIVITKARMRTIDERRADGASDEDLESYVLTELAKQTSTAQSGTTDAAGNPGTLSNQTVRDLLNSRLLAAQLREQRLLRQFGESHEKVVAARSEIDTILESYKAYNIQPPTVRADGLVASGQSESIVELYRRSLDNKLIELNLHLDALTDAFDKAMSVAREADVFQMRDNRDMDRLESLRNQRRLAQESEALLELTGEQSGFIMEKIGQTKTELAIKRPIKIVGAVMLCALGLASMLQYVREMSNTSLRTLDDVRRQLPGPLVGSVPEFPPATEADIAEAERTGLGTDLRYFHRPGSLAAESYRSVRTALFHLLPEGRRALQITSSEAGDGKSTLVGNLGIAMAQSGKRVLIIDADLRKPRVHRLFGVFGGTGLSDALEGELDWSEAVQGTHIERLHVLAAGSETSLPAELLSGPRLGDILQEAQNKYDWVLVDTPPILAVSDPCIVAQHVGGMVIVVRIEKNKKEAVQMATEMISNHNLPLVGVVANESPRESNRYYRTYISEEEQSRGQQRMINAAR